MPYLLRKLRATDRGRVQWNAFRSHLPASWQQHFPEKPSAKELHEGAARTISLIGPAAKSAVPELVRLLPEIPYQSLEALAMIGPGAREALPTLHRMQQDQNFSVRVEVAYAIWEIDHETNVVLEMCTNILALSPANAMNTCNVLGDLGPAAAPAVPLLFQVLQDTNSNARGNAAIALGIIRASTPEIREALLNGLKQDQNKNLQCNCAMALWGLDPGYAPLATRLVIEEIADQRKRFPKNEEDFTLWLSHRHLDPAQSVPTLRHLLESDLPGVRTEAAVALAKIERDARTAPKK